MSEQQGIIHAIRYMSGYVEGYGALGYSWCKAVYKNRLLEYVKCGEHNLSLQQHLLHEKWEAEFLKPEFESLALSGVLASVWCSICGGDTLDGVTHCVEKFFCYKCRDAGEIEKARTAWTVENKRKIDEWERERLEKQAADNLAVQERLSKAFHVKHDVYLEGTEDGLRLVSREHIKNDLHDYFYLKDLLFISQEEIKALKARGLDAILQM